VHIVAEEQAMQLVEQALQVAHLVRKNPSLQVLHEPAVGQVEQLATEQGTGFTQVKLMQI